MAFVTDGGKVRTLINGGQVFYCPGCEQTHALNSHPGGPRWSYNGDPHRPTFSPSILVTHRWSQNDPEMIDDICHSFVRDGKIQFLGDCTHPLKDKTIELPDWPYEKGKYGGIIEDAG